MERTRIDSEIHRIIFLLIRQSLDHGQIVLLYIALSMRINEFRTRRMRDGRWYEGLWEVSDFFD